MPETQAHQNKQSRTHLALSDLQQSRNSPHHADWIVTLAFYKALHAVDSYLVKLQIHPRGHLERNRHVRELLDEIFMQYDALYNASRVARYEAVTYQDDPEDVMMLVSSSRNMKDYINSLLEAHETSSLH